MYSVVLTNDTNISEIYVQYMLSKRRDHLIGMDTLFFLT